MFDSFIKSLPKTETHLHIEGALPYELLTRLDPAKYATVPASWAAGFRYPNFEAFDRHLLGLASPWFTSVERYHEAAEVMFAKLRHEQNVRYVETSFASGCIDFADLDGAAVAEAIASAAPKGMVVRVFMGIHHNGRTARTQKFLDECVDWAHLDGIDLHGNEAAPLEDWADGLWAKFRAAGKLTKAHAGELCGPAFVREVLARLHVTRLEHGVRAAEDPTLVARLRDEGVTLDVCPISNVKLAGIPSIKEHPLRGLFDAGVRCTINTDDPLVFGGTLGEVYEALASEGGFRCAELAQLARNGFEVAAVDEPTRRGWLAELDAAAKA